MIIVAGGSGMRMQTETPKQFLEVAGRVMLFRTIEAFAFAGNGVGKIVLVLPESWMSYWADLCKRESFDVAHEVVAGGAERFYSVKNGLSVVGEEFAFVGVHDGVRPFVSSGVIERALRVARERGAAVPVVEVSDSVRMLVDDDLGAVDGANSALDYGYCQSKALVRSCLRAVQTPQIFERKLLEKGYEQNFSAVFTDDASVVESVGGKVFLSVGDVANVKITYKQDL